MCKYCCYLLIIFLLLAAVFWLDYRQVKRELAEKLLAEEELFIAEKNPDDARQDLKQMLQQYLQTAESGSEQFSEEGAGNRFLPDLLPVKGELVLSQHFTEQHNGVDIVKPQGEKIYATAAGKIRKAGEDEYFGKLVIIDHLNGYQSYYGHLSELEVEENYFIEKGAVLGRVGSTGFSTGSHLHYAVSKDFAFINPELFWQR